MYLIELIVDKLKPKPRRSCSYDPLLEAERDGQPEEDCREHIFMPLDGTGEMLACRNCGLVVNKEQPENIFYVKSVH